MDLLDTKSIVSLDTKSVSSGNQFQQYSNSKDNVKVVIRVRPLNERERGNGGHKKCVTVENELTVHIESKPDFKSFNFDFVGDENIEQEVIFNQIARPIADGCLEGYNGTIFAYGQTGAGKTFTIQGPAIMVNGEEQIYGTNKIEGKGEVDKRGIMQRSFEYIFECIEKQRQKVDQSKDGSQFDFLVRCSYLEIYNEQIMDLLEPTSINLHIREDIKKGVYVEGLQEEVVSSAKDMMEIIQIGAKNRHVGSTSMNKESSRSHSVLTTIIETKSMKEGGVWHIKTSRFHIIDLAGSERSKYTNAVGERLKEAGMINKSLSALGNVINSLVDISEGKSRHVHYRDSKLTFLLRDSLGGNSKTVIIANISPSSLCYGETLSTLKFAQRAKLIRNKAVINEDSSGTIQILKAEIVRLKKELAENEQMYKQIEMNPNGFQCSLCKALIGNEIQEEEDEMLINNISVCEDLDSSVLNTTQTVGGQLNEVLKQKLKNNKDDLQKMRKRVVHLEGLLTANLDNMASQQKFYDNEILKHQQQNKKLQQAVESYEKQCARDKMIIKFREERINKLEQNAPITKDDQAKLIGDLRKEIQMWKDSADHNAQAAKLFAEKADLTNKLEQLKAEYKQAPDSLSAQMRQLTELNESLNQYLKLYCEESKKEVENELSKVKLDYAEKIEQLNEKLNEMKAKEQERKDKHNKQQQDMQELLNTYKAQIDKITSDYQREKLELEKNNQEQIEKIKNEIDQISENKTEQEKELQHFKIQIIEKDQQIAREKESKHELENQHQLKQQEFLKDLADLEGKLNELEDSNKKLELKLKQTHEHHELQLETERKQHSQYLKEQEAQWEENMREMERKIMEESSEKQMLQEQSDQLGDRIRSLEQENETIQQSLIYKDEQITEIQSEIKDKIKIINQLEEQKHALEQSNESQVQVNQEQIEQLKSQIAQLLTEKKTLQEQLDSAVSDKQDLQNALSDVKLEIEQLILEREELQQQIAQHLIKIESQSQKISDLEQQLDQQTSDLQINQQLQTDQITNLTAQISELQEQLNDKILQQDENQQIIVKLSSDLQVLRDERDQKELEIEQIKQHTEEQKSSLSTIMETKIKQMLEQEQERVYQIQQLTENLQTKDTELQQLQQNTQQIQQQITLQEQEIQNLMNEKQELLDEHIQQQESIQSQQIKEVEHHNEQLSLREVIIKKLETQIEEIKQQASLEVKQVKESITYEHQQVIEQLQEQHTLQIEEVKQQIEEQYQIQIEEVKLNVQQVVQEQAEQEKQQIIQENQVRIEEVTQQLQHQVQVITQQKEQEILEIQQQLEQIQEQKLDEVVQVQEEKFQELLIQKQQLEQNIVEISKEYEQRITTLQTDFQSQNESLKSNFELQLSIKQDELNQYQQTQQTLKAEIEQLEERIEELTKQKELEVELLMQKSNQDQQLLLTQANQQLNDKDIEIERLNESLVESKHKFILHQQQLQQLDQLIQDKNQQVVLLESKIETFTIQISELISQKSKIQELLQLQLNENQSLSKQLDTSLLQNEALQRQISQLQNDLHETLTTSQALQDQLMQQMTQKEQLQREIENLKSNCKQLQQQVQDNQATIQIREKELQNEIQNLKDQVDELEKDRFELNSQVSYRETVSNKYEHENQELKNKLLEMEQQQQIQQEELTQKSQEIQIIQVRIDQYDQQDQLLQQDLKKQKLLLDDTVNQLNNEYMIKLQEQEQSFTQQLSTVKQESDKYKQIAKDINHQNSKLKQDNEEQNSMLKQCRDTISRMAQKESDIMKELEKKINEFKDKHEKYKQRLEESKEQMKQLKFELEKSKLEAENLRELTKLKDRQIEEQQNQDERDKQALENITKENKDLRNQLTKREFELRDLVKRLKFYSEEKTRLEIELEKAHRENDELIGHKNPSQKIQHHVRIKEENNKLREENVRLQEELRRKIELLSKYQKGHHVDNNDHSSMNPQSKQELEMVMQSLKEDLNKYKKENQTYQETINRLVDHILSQPGLFKAIGLTQETNDKLMQQSGPVKVKKTMEIISMLSNLISSKEREVKDLEREVKQFECKLNILEKEKIMYKQQLEMMSNNGIPSGNMQNHYNHQNTTTPLLYNKRSPSISNQQSQQYQQQQQQFLMMQNQNELMQQQPQQKPSRLYVEGFHNDNDKAQQQNMQLQQQQQQQIDFHVIQNQIPPNIPQHQANQSSLSGMSKQSPSPLQNIRQQKEKENIQAKRDLFTQQQRSGSGRRTTYLSNGGQQLQQNYMHK